MSQQIPFSERRMIENEKITRTQNKVAKDAIDKYFAHDPAMRQQPLEFYCECSDMSCRKRIKLSIAEYEKLHRRNDRFIVCAGHELPDIEKIVDTNKSFVVVEKFAVPA